MDHTVTHFWHQITLGRRSWRVVAVALLAVAADLRLCCSPPVALHPCLHHIGWGKHGFRWTGHLLGLTVWFGLMRLLMMTLLLLRPSFFIAPMSMMMLTMRSHHRQRPLAFPPRPSFTIISFIRLCRP